VMRVADGVNFVQVVVRIVTHAAALILLIHAANPSAGRW
jgi:hypothetical protein